MCGIFISNNSKVNQSHAHVIEKTLRFRGPDCSSGLIEHRGWLAYHSRLSIIDIESGVNQPVEDDSGGLLVFNGEVLNYKELGRKYFNEEFLSDTIVLSRLLEVDKLDINEIDGFFAFVYIDGDGQLKRAARDKFGVKPIFYHLDEDGISFSSEPNTLKQIFGLEVNPVAVEEYRSLRAPVFSASYFKSIKEVAPGECFVQGQYFNCLEKLNGKYLNKNNDELLDALKNGVETRLISDAKVGLLLSRGIDSNLIRNIGDFDNYYTIGFENDEDIRYLKSQNIPKLTSVEVSAEEYRNAFKYLLELRGEPMSVPNEVLLYIVAKKAAEDGVKVLLSGEGADEFFGGYDRVFQWAYKAKKFDLDKFLSLYCYSVPNKNSILYNKFKSVFNDNIFVSPFETVRWFFIRHHMPVLFRRLDFSLMAAGVEGREPIANSHVFEVSRRLKPKDLMGTVLGKLPLREVIEKYMGAEFAYEEKIGFPVDLTKVFQNDGKLSSYELWFKENLKVIE